MIVVYGSAEGGPSEARTFGGHASIALTKAAGKPVYISWVRTPGKGAILDKFTNTHFGDPVYRVEIPTNLDGNGSGLDENLAWERWDELSKDGARKAEKERKGLGRDNPAYSNYAPLAQLDGQSQDYQYLYGDYNCVQIVKTLLEAAGGYDGRCGCCGLHFSLTVASVCVDAANMRDAILKSDATLDRSEDEEYNTFFEADKYVNQNRLPWRIF